MMILFTFYLVNPTAVLNLLVAKHTQISINRNIIKECFSRSYTSNNLEIILFAA